MSEEFVPDDRFIRSCILYDVKRKKSFIESYEDFRAAFGQNLISRDDFHFWYSRFSEGHRDLDFERNPENPPTPMTDKQKFALGIVSKYLGLRDQLRLPKITKEMYSHDRIYSDRKNYEMLDFMISADFIAVKYTKDIQVIYKLPYSEAKGKYMIVDVDPIGRLYMDLRYVIWSKVNRFERIHFYYDRRAVDEKRNETIQMGDELFLRFGVSLSFLERFGGFRSISEYFKNSEVSGKFWNFLKVQKFE
uniref:HTH_48 domain-containing protein n=1 Tax=Caenorhabditis tropicalis TaxID=1561998 RepID=A0A1I7UEJ2_9PELO